MLTSSSSKIYRLHKLKCVIVKLHINLDWPGGSGTCRPMCVKGCCMVSYYAGEMCKITNSDFASGFSLESE